MTKLETAKANEHKEDKQVPKQNEKNCDVIIGNVSLENHFKQLNGCMSKLLTEFQKVKNDNVELVKLVSSMSKSHKALMDELKVARNEIAALKNNVKEDVDSAKFVEEKEAGESVTIYTDASYDYETKQGTYGIVTVQDDGRADEYSGLVEIVDYIKFVSPVYGEAYAIIKALEIASKNGYKEVLLYTDNMEVENWSEMGNQTQNNFAIWFYNEVQKFSSKMNVTIIWMKRCTGEYNTRADELARLSLAQYNFLLYDQKAEEKLETVA